MYLLDTNILSEIMRREPDRRVLARLEAIPDDQLFTSTICIEEISYGAAIAPVGNRIWERFEKEVLQWITVLDFDLNSALNGGPMRGTWKQRGTPVGYADCLLAATAAACGLILVTRNVRHFAHESTLKVENWFE